MASGIFDPRYRPKSVQQLAAEELGQALRNGRVLVSLETTPNFLRDADASPPGDLALPTLPESWKKVQPVIHFIQINDPMLSRMRQAFEAKGFTTQEGGPSRFDRREPI